MGALASTLFRARHTELSIALDIKYSMGMQFLLQIALLASVSIELVIGYCGQRCHSESSVRDSRTNFPSERFDYTTWTSGTKKTCYCESTGSRPVNMECPGGLVPNLPPNQPSIYCYYKDWRARDRKAEELKRIRRTILLEDGKSRTWFWYPKVPFWEGKAKCYCVRWLDYQ